MAETTKIQWTDATFNPWRGCTKVSAGCTHCYAEAMSKRNPAVLGVWGDGGTRVVASEAKWREPVKWNLAAAKAGKPMRVFCASLGDVFEDRPELVAPRVRLFHLINQTPWLKWQLLTKRPQNVRRFHGGEDARRSWAESMPANVWLGVSVENQAAADERIPILLSIPAKVRFLSMEPLLGPVDLSRIPGLRFPGVTTHDALRGRLYHHDDGDRWTKDARLHWVITGCESGAKRRPSEDDWFRSLRDQCGAAGVPFFLKQKVEGGVVVGTPELDGRTWEECP